MFQSNLLKGKRVLITGGGTGLGKSIGMRMIGLGAELMICGRRAQVLEDTAKEFENSFSCKVRTHVIDVRSAKTVEGLMDAAFTGGPLDVLINNAAGNFIARISRRCAPLEDRAASSGMCRRSHRRQRAPRGALDAPD